MAYKRVTLQDLADACGLSRNTVSKVFNERGTVTESTKAFILQKAHEIGFSQIPETISVTHTSEINEKNSVIPKSIAVLFNSNPLDHSFGSFFIKAFSDQICRSGYTVQLYELSDTEITSKKIPPHVSVTNTAGILCIELFDKEYLQDLCKQEIPVIIIDGFCNAKKTLLNCDFISTENIASTIEITNRMINKGAKSIGFIGDYNHCQSFYDRWIGYQTALKDSGIVFDNRICITEKDNEPYGNTEWIKSKIEKMPYLPDAFFCVNDFHAVHIMTVLKGKGIDIPGKVMIAGFDDSPESKVISPSLTTAQIPGTDMGYIAAEQLITRINNPTRAYTNTYIKTTTVFRESTK